jgi:hypothetical protein
MSYLVLGIAMVAALYESCITVDTDTAASDAAVMAAIKSVITASTSVTASDDIPKTCNDTAAAAAATANANANANAAAESVPL